MSWDRILVLTVSMGAAACHVVLPLRTADSPATDASDLAHPGDADRPPKERSIPGAEMSVTGDARPDGDLRPAQDQKVGPSTCTQWTDWACGSLKTGTCEASCTNALGTYLITCYGQNCDCSALGQLQVDCSPNSLKDCEACHESFESGPCCNP